MRLLLIFLLLLIALPVYAGGPEMLLLVTTDSTVPFTINGYSSLASPGSSDTGTQSVTTGAGSIRVSAACTATATDLSGCNLMVEGATVDYLSCPGGTGTASKTLYASVTAGSHNVRIFCLFSGGASITATNFRKPKP
jgi:hypothetical protein